MSTIERTRGYEATETRMLPRTIVTIATMGLTTAVLLVAAAVAYVEGHWHLAVTLTVTGALVLSGAGSLAMRDASRIHRHRR